MTIPLDPLYIAKFVNQLLIPPVFKPTIATDPRTSIVLSHNYTINMTQLKQQILPHYFPKTNVWGYEGTIIDPCNGKEAYFSSTPGPTFEAVRGIPIHVQWVNNITKPNFRSSCYYPNEQLPTTLWYQDYTLETTRSGVYAGLGGFYILRDPDNKIEKNLPKAPYEIPIVIQDQSFNKDGSLLYLNRGLNPDIHPYWVPESFGNTIMVNGRVWPNLNVERRQYRFRFLNGSKARFYNMKLSNNQSSIQIGSDGGFLESPVKLKELLLSPAERADVLIDFSKVEPGTKIIITNDANAPFPDGDPPDFETTGQLMQFTVLDTPVVLPVILPAKLANIPTLTPNVPRTVLTLNDEDNEMMGPYKVTTCPLPVANTQSCCQIMVEGGTHLVPPALVDEPIMHNDQVFAKIEKVCPDKVVISGFVCRTITYTALDCGAEREHEIIDDIPFQCMIDHEDANEDDTFVITRATILCDVFAEAKNIGLDKKTNQAVAYKFVEKDIIKVCIRKDCQR